MFDEDARRQHDIFDGAKFSANPFADPKMWAWAAKSPGLFSDTWKAGVADLFDSVRQARSQKSDAVKTAAIADLGRGVFRSMDKEWRILADRYKSKTMDDIRTMFHAIPDVGRGGAVETTYHEGILEHGQGNLNKVADIFKPLISLLQDTPCIGSLLAPLIGSAINQTISVNLDQLVPTNKQVAYTYKVTSFDGTLISMNYFPAATPSLLTDLGNQQATIFNGPGLGGAGVID